MSLDSKVESDAYEAIGQVATIPRPNERKRICMEIIRLAAKVGDIEMEIR